MAFSARRIDEDGESSAGAYVSRNHASLRDTWGLVRPAPRTVAESGLPSALLEDLVLKALRMRETPTLIELARMLCLHTQLCEQVIDALANRKLTKIEAAESMLRAHYRFGLTAEGKAAADEALRRSAYCGPAPVPLEHYTASVKSQTGARRPPAPHTVRACLAHLVLPLQTIDALGQAFASGRPIIVYGPSGNGKTDVVTSLANCVEGNVLLPHALYAQGHIIEVFDPQLHMRMLNSELDSVDVDRRWREVRRPVAIAGGEMDDSALDLSYDPVRNVHVAPLSVRAQGGVLVIDDLGRQRASVQTILNRWIQLMETGADRFTLNSGEGITVPLDVTLIFSTNLRLADLTDEAYLRRISYKIPIANPTQAEFAEITRRACLSAELDVDDRALQYLVEKLYSIRGIEPRACYARDLVQTVIDYAKYFDAEARLDQTTSDRALQLYLGERLESSKPSTS